MMSMLQNANWALIFGTLYGLCEVLANIPAVESNSVFQLIFNVAKTIKSKFTGSSDTKAS